MIQKIKSNNNKVLFISDLHLGIHQNSQTWHTICLDVAKWVRSVMQENSLDTIFFAGDVFHDRHEIGVNTLYVAKKFFDILKEYQIHILPGNHDAFLSNTVEVNSVEILAQSNIHVYANPTTLNVNGKLVTFCPWKTSIKDLAKVDMLVGHFELINFKLNNHKICDHGDCATNLFEKASYVVTGHFHSRDHRVYEDGKYVLYLGSPYEMDFGDRGQDKGVSIINFDNLNDVEFVKNEITPKHIRIKVSELTQKKHKNVPDIVKNNIVSLYVDTKLDTLTLDLLITKLSQYGPLQFRTEFDALDVAQLETTETQKFSIDIETAFQEFVELIETRAVKKDVLHKCLELYKQSQISYE